MLDEKPGGATADPSLASRITAEQDRCVMNNEKSPTSDPAMSGELPEDRRIWISARESAAATRDRALAEREELLRLCELALDARRRVTTS